MPCADVLPDPNSDTTVVDLSAAAQGGKAEQDKAGSEAPQAGSAGSNFRQGACAAEQQIAFWHLHASTMACTGCGENRPKGYPQKARSDQCPGSLSGKNVTRSLPSG